MVLGVAEGDSGELQDGGRKLAHICEVQLDHVVLLHFLCQAAPDLLPQRVTAVRIRLIKP